MKIINWFKTLARIVRDYDDTCEGLEAGLIQAEAAAQQAINRADAAERIIRERTELSTDLAVGRQGYSTIIVTGQYHNTDYVRVFKVHHECLKDLVPHLLKEARYAQPRFIDTPSPEMRAVIARDVLRR